MVVVKTARELSKMKDACRISAEALRVAGEAVKPGVTTYEIDNIVRSYIEKQ
ncbi:methionine aminopeptidase, type I, partial [human gut metagenome]